MCSLVCLFFFVIVDISIYPLSWQTPPCSFSQTQAFYSVALAHRQAVPIMSISEVSGINYRMQKNLKHMHDLEKKAHTEKINKNQMCMMMMIFFFFRALHSAYGSSQARSQIRAIDASLCHSHSNARSEPRLRPTPQLTSMLDP